MRRRAALQASVTSERLGVDFGGWIAIARTLLSQRYATFYSLPCRVAAALSKLPATWSDSLSAFGHDLGMALQLQRQAESARGDCADPPFGPVSTGLANRALTLPLIQALASEDGTGCGRCWGPVFVAAARMTRSCQSCGRAVAWPA
jgi:hypothetical protein